MTRLTKRHIAGWSFLLFLLMAFEVPMMLCTKIMPLQFIFIAGLVFSGIAWYELDK